MINIIATTCADAPLFTEGMYTFVYQNSDQGSYISSL